MIDAAISFLWPDAATEHTLLGPDVSSQPAPGSNYSLIRLADGWATATPLTDSEFHGLCRALQLEEVARDPRFATVADRMANVDALGALFRNEIAAAAAKLSREQAGTALDAEDVPAGVVRTLDELHSDPQVIANRTLVESEHPVAGRLREPRPAPRFARTAAQVGAGAPTPGQHTDEVLSELGLADEIADLRRQKIVA